MDNRLAAIGALLYLNRTLRHEFLDFLIGGKRTSKANANVFFLGSILDYQISSQQALQNAKRLCDDILGTRDDIWIKISKFTPSRWRSKGETYRLHRYPKAHVRVHRIARELVREYSGDAGEIWKGQKIGAVQQMLSHLQVGEYVSRMILMSLFESGILKGDAAPSFEKRSRTVLGRAVRGEPYERDEMEQFQEAAQEVIPSNPWLIDQQLYLLGEYVCKPPAPTCSDCYLPQFCDYYQKYFGDRSTPKQNAIQYPLDISSESIRFHRENLEKEFAPRDRRAYSIDGRTFGYTAPLSKPLEVGSYVTVSSGPEEQYLCQITDEGRDDSVKGPEFGIELLPGGIARMAPSADAVMKHSIGVSQVRGAGIILKRIVDGLPIGLSEPAYFQDAKIKLAKGEVIDKYLKDGLRDTETICVGTTLKPNKLTNVTLHKRGFSEATFICGQSRSGKTTSLAIMIERLMFFDESARIVILDPNSQFINMTEIRAEAKVAESMTEGVECYRYAEVSQLFSELKQHIKIFRPRNIPDKGARPLAIRFGELTINDQATLLRMDPVIDRDEFEVLREEVRAPGWLRAFMKRDISHQGSTGAKMLKQRMKNLDIMELDVLCRGGEQSCVEELRQSDGIPKCAVYDIGSFESSIDKEIVSMVVIEEIWAKRVSQERIYLVVDEAHTLSSPNPDNPIGERINHGLLTIAKEGSKYGLHLIVSTQQPSNIHPELLTSCKNLILMRLPLVDLNRIYEAFSFIPAPMVYMVKDFDVGEALVAGGIISRPTFVRFEGRFLQEG